MMTQLMAGDDVDIEALERWVKDRLPGFRGPVRLSRFPGGQSNPTFRLDTPDRAYVLRRKPLGELLPSAHAVDREFRVTRALSDAGFPVARPHLLCSDASVIGVDWYLMDLVEGRIFWDGTLAELPRERRAGVYRSQIKTLAQLHTLDPVAIGLEDYGRPGNYFERQIGRWSKQYRASETEPNADFDHLIDWLPHTLPADDGRVSVVHGDYRIDNLIFDADDDRVAAVLDWELSTLGDPLADFTYLLMNWVTPPDQPASLAAVADLAAWGLPRRDEAIALYCDLTGRSGIANLDWYFAYNLFRLAAIYQGILARARQGNASSAEALTVGARAPLLAAAARLFAERAGA
jgi:aminoglycoside phosphotransferase (APT) family kinase protein